MRGRTVVMAVLFVVACGVLLFTQRDDGAAEPNFCYADGLISGSGEVYGRRGDDCRFVDDDGNEITELDGEPVCYDDGGTVKLGAECL